AIGVQALAQSAVKAANATGRRRGIALSRRPWTLIGPAARRACGAATNAAAPGSARSRGTRPNSQSTTRSVSLDNILPEASTGSRFGRGSEKAFVAPGVPPRHGFG